MRREFRVTTYWTAGGSSTFEDLDYTQASDTAFAHRKYGHRCVVEFREVGPWTRKEEEIARDARPAFR